MKPIEIRELTKSFKLKGKPIKALDGISFEVANGDSVVFIGQNGAGKSTTIKLLFGAMRPDSGESLLRGRHSSDPQSRKGVGYVPENPYLYELLTPREIISSGLRLHGVRGEENTCRTERWLDKLEISYAADKRIRSLSKGMTQRTALAHAFAIEPELLILDEPMSGLDPVGRRQVADLMQEYRQGGGTLFFSSHILHDVERLADRFVMIHRGKIQAQQSISDMLTSQGDMIVRYYGTKAVEGFERDAGQVWRGRFQRGEIEKVLSAIIQASGTLLDIHPRNSLEALFDSITGFTG